MVFECREQRWRRWEDICLPLDSVIPVVAGVQLDDHLLLLDLRTSTAMHRRFLYDDCLDLVT